MTDVSRAEALAYELPALRAHIEKRHANIAVFEQAIADERAEIARELQMIAILEAEDGGP